MPKLSFQQVQDIYDQAKVKEPSFASMPIQDFAKYAGSVDPEYDYSSATTGVGLKRASAAIDRFLKPVGDVTGAVGKGVGGMFGPTAESVGESVGRGLPRATVDTLAALGGTAIGGPVGIPLAIAGYGSTFAKGYTDTNSKLGGAVAAGTTALMPGAYKVGSELVGKGLAKVAPIAPVAERTLEYLGGQAGVAGLQTGGQVAQGENPFTKENAIATVAGTLPFAGLEAPMLAKGYKVGKGGRPEGANLVDLAKGTPTPITSLADWFRQQDAAAELRSVGRSMDAVAQAHNIEGNVERTEQRVVEAKPGVEPIQPEVATPKQPDLLSVPQNIRYETLKDSYGYANGKSSKFGPKGSSGTTDLTVFVSMPVARDLLGQIGEGKKGLVKVEDLGTTQMYGGGGRYQLLKLGEDGKPVDTYDFPAAHTPTKGSVAVSLQGDRVEVGLPISKVHGVPEKQAMEFPKPDPEYTGRLLTKMEELGASPEQLDRVAQISDVTQAPKFDIDLARESALREMLGTVDLVLGVPSEDATIRGLATFYTKLFQVRGFEPDKIERLTRLSAKIGSAMGQTRMVVGPTSDPNSFFMPLTKTAEGKVVGLTYSPTYKAPTWELAHKLWEVGHEFTHGWFNDAKLNVGDKLANRILSTSYEVFKDYTPDELSTVVQALHKSIFPSDEKGLPLGSTLQGQQTDARTTIAGLATRKKVYGEGESGVREAMGDVVGLLAMGIASPSENAKGLTTLKELMKFSDPRIADFTQQVFTDFGAAMHANEGLLDGLFQEQTGVKEGFVPGSTRVITAGQRAEGLQQAMRTLASIMEEKANSDAAKVYLSTVAGNMEGSPLMRELSYENISKSYKIAQQLAFNDPEVPNNKEEFKWLSDTVKDTYDRVSANKEWQKKSGIQPSFVDKFKPMPQFVEDYPMFKPIFRLGLKINELGNENARELWKSFLRPDGSGKVDEELVGSLGSELNKPFSEVLLRQNMDQENITDEQFKKVTAGMPEDKVALLKRGLNATSEMNMKAAMMRANGWDKELKDKFTMILVREGKLKPEQATMVAEDAFGHILLNQPASPLLTTLPTSLFSTLSDFGQTIKPQRDEIRKVLLGDDGQGKPWWSSEVRLGDFYVGWREGTQSGLEGFHTKKEAVDFLQTLRDKGIPEDKIKAWDKYDRLEQYRGLDKGLVEKFAEADEVTYNKMLSMMTDLTPEEKEYMRELFQPGQGARRMVTPAAMQERNMQLGREDLNMMAGVMHYADSTALGLAKQYIKSQLGVVLHSEDLRANPNIQTLGKDYINNLISPPGKEFNTLKSLVFMNYLGFNVSNWFIEPTQIALSHVPFLVRNGLGIGEAYKLVTSAATKAAKFAFGGKASDKDFDPILFKKLQEWQAEGGEGAGFVQDILMTEDVNTLNLRRLARGENSLLNPLDLAKKPLYWLLKSAKSFYGVTSKLTSRTAFISSYEYAKSQGKTPEQAAAFARDSVPTTAYTGGKASRPLVLGMLGKAQGVGGLLYALQGFTFNTVAYMARLGRESLLKSDLSPIERRQAMKSFGLMLGTQVALGGAMGLPMVAGAIGVIEQLFPESEIRKDLRETVAHLFTDDKEMGSLVADSALNGLFNVGPIDFGSRFQLGNAFGIDARNGFQWSNLAGPGANMVARWVQGAQSLGKGELGQALQSVAPSGLRGIADLATNNWQERDKFGNLLYNPTPLQSLARVAGFRPKELNQYYEQLSINNRSEKIAGEQLNRFHQQLSDMLVQGQVEPVRQALVERQQTQGGYDAREGARQVAELAQRRVVPSVPLQSGRRTTIDERAGLQSSYTGSGQEPSALQRLQVTKQFESALRIPGVGKIGRLEVTKAQMIDQVRAQNPTLTYPQASLMVEKAMTPKRFLPVQ